MHAFIKSYLNLLIWNFWDEVGLSSWMFKSYNQLQKGLSWLRNIFGLSNWYFSVLQELFPCHPYKLWVNKASKIVKSNCNENFEEGRGGIPCNSVSDGHFFFQQKCVKFFAISCSALVSRGLWLAVVC